MMSHTESSPVTPSAAPPATSALDGQRAGPWPWLALAAVLAAYLAIAWPQLSIPLSRDEGEYAYGGQLIRAGRLPYVELYAMKLPGMYLAMALIQAVGGESIATLHLGAALVNAATACVLFLIARQLFGAVEGVAAAAAFLLWMLNPHAEPLAAQAEVFVVLPAALGWWLLLAALDGLGGGRRVWAAWFASGLCFGVAILMKQHGTMLMLGAGAYTAWRVWREGSHAVRAAVAPAAAWLAAVAAPWAAVAATYAALGRFERFWFWTVTTSRYYGASEPLSQGLANLTNEVSRQASGSPWVWLLAAVGATTPLWSSAARRHAPLLAALLVSAALAVSPKLLFRNHYFYLAGPAAAVLTAAALRALADLYAAAADSPAARRWGSAVLAAGLLGYTAMHDALIYRSYTPERLSRAAYGLSGFPESVAIAEFLKAHTEPDEQIAVLGSEPQLFYLSGRRSASPHIYTYPLMEPNEHAPQLQAEMIADIERVQPPWLVWVNSPQSWLPRHGSHQRILEWFGEYRQTQCELVEVYDLLSGEETVRREGAAAREYTPRGPVWLGIYRRLEKSNP